MTKEKKTTAAEQAFTLSPQELKALVQGVQRNDEELTLKFCTVFKPLVEASARRFSIFTALGEDALSIAWILLLEFVKGYEGTRYASLPGLFKAVLQKRLLNCIRYDAKSNCETHLEACNREEFFTSTFEEEIVRDLDLLQALQKLSAKEMDFLYWRYILGFSYVEIAALKHKPLHVLWWMNKSCLKKLRRLYLAKRK